MTIPALLSHELVADLVVGEREAESDQVVAVSASLWDMLRNSQSSAFTSIQNTSNKINISLRLTSGKALRLSNIPALVVYAVKSQQDTSGLWLEASKSIASALGSSSRCYRTEQGRRVSIEPHTLLDVSLVYLQAMSLSSYDAANTNQEELMRQLDGKVLRQGQVIRPQLGPWAAPLRVIMLEPLLQGVFSAESSDVLLTLQADGTDEHQLDSSMISSMTEDSFSVITGSDAGSAANQGSNSADELRDEDDLEIDERFLAQTVLEDFSNFDISIDPATDGKLRSSAARSSSRAKRCTLLQLQEPSALNAAISHWYTQTFTSSETCLKGSAQDNIDEENVVLASEKDMASLGAFNGDWLAASTEDHSRIRLVRVLSSQDLAASTYGSPTVYMSPVLAQNIVGDQVFSPSPRSVVLRVLGSRPSNQSQDFSALVRSCPVPVPFAESLRIARVAGPLSVDRAYQGLFLDALRTFFENRRRICRNGDIIAVAIEANKARFAGREAEQEAGSESAPDDIHDLKLPSASSAAKTATVYFKVTDLRSELVAPDNNAAAENKDEAIRTLSLQAQIGELGCIVDPNVTKMVQTGVEQCRVADCDSWLGVSSDTPALPTELTSTELRTLTAPLIAPSSPYATLSSLLNATLQSNAGRFGLHLSVLLKGARGCGKKTVARWVAKAAGVQLVEVDCFDVISDTDVRTEGILRARFQKAAECAPCMFLLRNIEALARKSQALETGQEPPLATALASCFEEMWSATSSDRGLPVAVFGTTSDPDKCPSGVLGCFKHEVAFNAPNEAERRAMLEITMKDSILGPDLDLKNLATQTAALVAADLVNLASRSKLMSVTRVRKALPASAATVSDRDLFLAGLAITGTDLDQALNKARSSYSESIGAPKIPNVTWDDVGGLASVKSDILDTIQLPLEHPELFSDGLKKRSGILLYGPPGTGKTLLAKAVATSCSLNFFSVKGPELLNMYIGESEANVRRVFQRARDAKPCVIFFDELDSVAPKRGNQGDSGGVMDRIVSQLLAELDGMAGSSEGSDVFVIGATNRPDLLDPALLRPGRFDRMLYLSVSETHAAQLNILQALTRKFKLDPDVGNLGCIAEQCPFNLTGADFYALCSDAMLKAMTRKASEVDARIEEINATPGRKEHPHPLTAQYYLAEMASADEIEVKVNRRDFEAALRELTPSVSEQEMQHYREVQAKFSSPKKDDAQEKGKEASQRGNTTDEHRLLATLEKAMPNGAAGPELKQLLAAHTKPEDASERQADKGKGKAKAEEAHGEDEVAAEARRHAKRKGKAV
ncbi:related to PEX6 - peroxisomal assembly protein [Melanopsichium pennsylvanicum]|uniref:Peroxisomal ATPase PEX6 n=2 Tax=Melanopsichium pennsylvanicum TaxID=63383 RepID=A0AAJ5C349_9BASI|nr:related to PEX6-peroxisomal assembly protein [Melanopsichium pennsylvanicum 4]SNX82109.1 related to PEX6 - peroxisomal assembly protein [Melanopsichium pennsylvanicum]